MKRTSQLAILAAAAFAIALSPAYRVKADDETQDTEIKIRATLDSTDCTATPPTVSVLGLTIDVSTATLDVSGAGTDAGEVDDGPSHHGGARGGNDPAPGGCYYCAPVATPTPQLAAAAPSGCAALVVGQLVEVQLATDASPLIATKVEQSGNSQAEAEIKAPIQSLDSTTHTITLLGLTVDVSGAGLDGSDDSDESAAAIDASQLMVGQFVEVKLASSSAPLAATELEVKNFSNHLEVEVVDAQGHEVNDLDDNGDPIDDVSVDVVENVNVQAGPVDTVPARTVKRLHFHTGSNGHFTLNGLPAGVGKISVSRTSGGTTTTSRRAIRVRGNSTRTVRIRLRPAHH